MGRTTDEQLYRQTTRLENNLKTTKHIITERTTTGYNILIMDTKDPFKTIKLNTKPLTKGQAWETLATINNLLEKGSF